MRRAVLIFCEGNHDVVFVTRSLGQLPKASWVGSPIGKLPSPFGPVPDPNNPQKPILEGLIAKRYSGRVLSDLRLQAAGHAPLPSFEAMVQVADTLYVLIRCHGDSAAQSAIQLIADLKAVISPAIGTDVQQVASAFIFDADASLSGRESHFASTYAALLRGVTPPKHGEWVRASSPTGLYVCHDVTSKQGTLEETLALMVSTEWPMRWKAANAYLTTHAESNDPVQSKRSEWLKAQVTIAGQQLCPGDPMTEVLRKLPGQRFSSPESQALVAFLQSTPW